MNRLIIIDIDKMTNSKEIYERRPNPFIALFIYFLAALFIVVAVYSYFGKVEVVASVKGEIRPNDDVSTVKSMIEGKIIEVCCTDGQAVNKGDILYRVDMSESKIVLEGLKKQRKKLRFQINMSKKLLNSIEQGRNLFSPNPNGKEYPYFTEFCELALSIKDTKINSEYNQATLTSKIESIKKQIRDNEYKIGGLKAYKNSLEKEKNMAKDYPEFSAKYLLYKSTIDSLRSDYLAKKRQIEVETEDISYSHALSYYQNQIDGYNNIINSIETGNSSFSPKDNSVYKRLYDDYLNSMAEYGRNYQNAQLEYQYLLEKKKKGGEDIDMTTLDYNISEAAVKVSSAGSDTETYKNKKILEYKQILSEIKNSQEEVQIKRTSFISKEEKLSELLNAYENSKNQQYYTAMNQANDLLDSLKETNNSDKSELKTYALSYRLSEESVDENGENITIKTNIVRKTSEILENLEKLKGEERILSNQIKQAKQQIKEGTIIAEKKGVVNVVLNLVEGDLNPAGATVATIIPEGENKFKAQLYVSNADIADIEKGDAVRYSLFAMPSNKYSSANGKVKKISNDSILQDGEHSGFYLIEATINESALTDKDGNRSEIAIGMQTEAKIITKKKRIITYLLEKMDIFW